MTAIYCVLPLLFVSYSLPYVHNVCPVLCFSQWRPSSCDPGSAFSSMSAQRASASTLCSSWSFPFFTEDQFFLCEKNITTCIHNKENQTRTGRSESSHRVSRHRRPRPGLCLPVFRQLHDGGRSGGERDEGHPQHGAGRGQIKTSHIHQLLMICAEKLVWLHLASRFSLFHFAQK